MKFTQFRQQADLIRAETGIHKREEMIRNLLNACDDPEESVIAAKFLVGKLTSPSQDLTFGIKETFLAKDLGMEGRQSLEDIAKVAMERAECGESNPSLQTVFDVYWDFLVNGGRSNVAKSSIINRILFGAAKSKDDIPLLLQILCEKVNNGVDAKLVLHALGAEHYSREDLTRAFAFNPNLAEWIHDFYAGLLVGDPLSPVPVPGVPLEPQLCARVGNLPQVLKEHHGVTLVQPKLDGQRVHIHIWNDFGFRAVRIYSRTLKDITEDYPEIVGACATVPIESRCILDGELVALGPDGEIAPFAVLQKRLGRKNDRESIQVGVVLYDVLLWDEQTLSQTMYDYRLVLAELAAQDNPLLRVIPCRKTNSAVDLQAMLLAAYEEGEEGLVCKDPMSFPEPGARNKTWVKLKGSYMTEEAFGGDTFDLVVIGYNRGRGRRHGKIGALWTAIRHDSGLSPVCKVGTGFTDEDLDWWTENLQPVDEVPDGLGGIGEPPELDHWVEPKHVIEVKAIGGMTKIDKWAGFALRFPTFLRLRDDKTVEQATNTSEIQIHDVRKP